MWGTASVGMGYSISWETILLLLLSKFSALKTIEGLISQSDLGQVKYAMTIRDLLMSLIGLKWQWVSTTLKLKWDFLNIHISQLFSTIEWFVLHIIVFILCLFYLSSVYTVILITISETFTFWSSCLLFHVTIGQRALLCVMLLQESVFRNVQFVLRIPAHWIKGLL